MPDKRQTVTVTSTLTKRKPNTIKASLIITMADAERAPISATGPDPAANASDINDATATATEESPIDAIMMACNDANCDFKPVRLQRRPLGPHDVEMDVKYCGVCHSDLHVAANHLKMAGNGAQYPCVPGHEFAGVCVRVGAEVKKIKVGDQVGVGCLVDSCHDCAQCLAGEEQKCKTRVGTYNSKKKTIREVSFPPGTLHVSVQYVD